MDKGTKINLNELRDLVWKYTPEYDSITKEKDDEEVF